MKVMFETKGDFDNMTKWLDKVSKADPTPALSSIAKEGGRSLSSKTPKDTGETASGWTAVIQTKGAVSEVHWVNNAHPGLNVNLAILIDQGHGTGTGGYVAPRPYIKEAMESIWRTAGDKIAKELVK